MDGVVMSDRARLLRRVERDAVAQRLAKNVLSLSRAQSRLKTSRCSSERSQGNRELPRKYSYTDLQNESRNMLLRSIADKLKQTRKQEMVQKDSNILSGSRVSKLGGMLQGIKRCNQLSTKAIYSIKKEHINQGLKGGPLQGFSSQIKEVRAQLARLRAQNQALLKIVRGGDGGCPTCGCRCGKGKKIFEFK